jgi:hypothetical protein
MQNDTIKDLKPVSDENRRIPNFSQLSGPILGSPQTKKSNQ